jgi:hypothetical protein
MQGLVGVAVPLLALVVVASALGRMAARRPNHPLAVAKRRFLLSRAEKSFYLVLCKCVPQSYVIFPKVRLADLLDAKGSGRDYWACHNKLTAKHVDFVICDREWLEPRVAVELDDRSHERRDRQQRDEFVSAAMGAAGLALLRIRAQAAYNVGELQESVRRALSSTPVVGRAQSPTG